MDETRSGKSRDTPFATVRATFCSNRCRRPIRNPHLLNAEFYRFRPTVAANSCTETCLMYCSLKTFTGNVYIYIWYIYYIYSIIIKYEVCALRIRDISCSCKQRSCIVQNCNVLYPLCILQKLYKSVDVTLLT